MSIPREHRLRKHSEFELVYRSGRRHFSPVLTAFYLLREHRDSTSAHSGEGAAASSPGSGATDSRCRVGITVGRALGKSTVRNRIKRRIRAAVGENLGKISRPIDVVINPKKAVLEAEFKILCSEVARAFDVIEQKATFSARKQNQRGSRNPESQRTSQQSIRGELEARKS